MTRRLILAALLLSASAQAAAIDYNSMRLYWSNQPGTFATGTTDVSLVNDAFILFTDGFTFHSELCEEGSCSVPTGNSQLGLRLTNTLVTCAHPTCGGFVLFFLATGTLNSPISISVSMDNIGWNTLHPVHGDVQLGVQTLLPNNAGVAESHGTSFAFDSSSPTAGSPAQLSFSHLGAIEIGGLIEFNFPNGYVAQSLGDTFALPDSLVMSVTPLASVPGAPEPGTCLLAAAGMAILLRRKKK